MFLLMLKTELPGGRTSLDFIGAYNTLNEAVDRAGKPFIGDTGHGNRRMLDASSTRETKRVWLTDLTPCGSRYLIAEF